MRYRKFLSTLPLLTVVLFLGGQGQANQPASRSAEQELIDAFIMRGAVRLMEIEDSGRKRWEVRGSHAESKSADVIRIYNVRATFIRDNGEEINVYTESADINRRTHEIQTELHVDIISGDRMLSGKGMHINHDERKFRLLENVEIVVYRQGGMPTLDMIR
ncbi:MAG: LPS export ABC transporter periplasmic protein LptC [bacterium]|nr:LPS export ABC transporter periplasmic protein LptC [bacterium]